MARIKLVSPEAATGKVKEIFDEIERTRGKGRVSNLFRAYANHLPSLELNWERTKRVMKSGLLPPKLKEAIGLTMAAVHQCHY